MSAKRVGRRHGLQPGDIVVTDDDDGSPGTVHGFTSETGTCIEVMHGRQTALVVARDVGAGVGVEVIVLVNGRLLWVSPASMRRLT